MKKKTEGFHDVLAFKYIMYTDFSSTNYTKYLNKVFKVSKQMLEVTYKFFVYVYLVFKCLYRIFKKSALLIGSKYHV